MALGGRQVKYVAHISSELQKHCFADIIEVPAVVDAKDGFWINKHGVFTRGEDAAMWIPASQILYVTKKINEE
jgi:hypothetical protein